MRGINTPCEIILEPVVRHRPRRRTGRLTRNSGRWGPSITGAGRGPPDPGRETFRQKIEAAVPFAEAGALVTFGIVPRLPETGYGYIRQGDPVDAEGVGFEVSGFVEKPDPDTAQSYLDAGDYLWNSGMFVFRASRYLEELDRHRPDILAPCQRDGPYNRRPRLPSCWC